MHISNRSFKNRIQKFIDLFVIVISHPSLSFIVPFCLFVCMFPFQHHQLYCYYTELTLMLNTENKKLQNTREITQLSSIFVHSPEKHSCSRLSFLFWALFQHWQAGCLSGSWTSASQRTNLQLKRNCDPTALVWFITTCAAVFHLLCQLEECSAIMCQIDVFCCYTYNIICKLSSTSSKITRHSTAGEQKNALS